jgi:putative ABC transport system permease protein
MTSAFRLQQDFRYAFRALRRSPAIALTAVFAIAIGIGASTAVFSAVDRILFRSLPYPAAEQLVSFGFKAPIEPEEFMLGNAYLQWKTSQHSFAAMGAFMPGLRDCDLTERNPARLACADVEPSLLATLQVSPLLGRTFSTEEGRRGGPKAALITYSLWRGRFGGDPGIIGRTISLDAQSVSIIGVLPADFEMPTLLSANVLMPVQIVQSTAPGSTGPVLRTIARLKPGVTAAQAAAELQSVAIADQWIPPRFLKEVKFTVRNLRDRQVGDYETASAVLLAAVIMVLLIACANVANVLLARATARRREQAVRSALGASRWRLLSEALAESMLLACAGGALGVALAYALLHLFSRIAPQGIPRLNQATLDLRVLGFAAAACIVSGIVFGLAPGLRRTTIEELIGGSKVTDRRISLRQALVVVQVAACIVLLSGASVLLRSLWNLEAEPLGFHADHVVTARIALGPAQYPTGEARMNFYSRLEQQLQAMLGAEAVAMSDSLPPAGAMHSQPYYAMLPEGRERLPEGTGGMVAWRAVTPDYFRAFDIPIAKGRAFNTDDRSGSRFSIIVSGSLAQKMFGAEDPLGKRIQRFPDVPTYYTVVGVAADVKNGGVNLAGDPEYYVVRRGIAADAVPGTIVIVRSALQPQLVSKWIRSDVAALDPTLPVEFETMSARVGKLMAAPRFNAVLLGMFAAMALLLAAIGLYGVMAFLVAQRTQEIGVRMALGATPAGIAKLVLTRAAAWTFAGAAIGMAASLAGARVMGSLLYHVQPRDPIALSVSVVVLGVVAMVAAFVPARRAAAVDPMVALRHE